MWCFTQNHSKHYLHIWNFSVKVQNPDLHFDLALLSLHVFVAALFPIPPSSRHMFQGVLLNAHPHSSATERTNVKLFSCLHGMLNVNQLAKTERQFFTLCFNFKSRIYVSIWSPNRVLEILTGLLCRALVYFTESWNREQWSLSSGSFMLEQHVL